MAVIILGQDTESRIVPEDTDLLCMYWDVHVNGFLLYLAGGYCSLLPIIE